MTTPSHGYDVTVVLTDNRHLPIKVDTLIGGFAVHPRIWGGQMLPGGGGGWSITHCTTGLLVHAVADYGEALRVAQWLEATKVIPEDREACLLWKANIPAAELTRFREQLHAIAPRR